MPQPAGDHRCGIHDHLARDGWRGCVTFDCFGAGQQVSQVTIGGVSWREAPDTAASMYAVLPVMRQLHEMLAHLHAALDLEPDESLRAGADLVAADLRGRDLRGARLDGALFLTRPQLAAART